MQDFPIRLKPEDSPSPADPHETGVELLRLLGSMAQDAAHLRALILEWSANPISVQRRAQSRAHEIHESALRAVDAGEALMRGLRAAGRFSQEYSRGR